MFVGRKKELNKLNSIYLDSQFHCVIIYGRRRVGKTFLLGHWMEDKEGVYFAAEQQSRHVLLKKLSDSILNVFPSEVINRFDDFEQALKYVGEMARDKETILVIDEVQFLAQQDKGFISMLQNLIDHFLIDTKLKLVLCGSYISFIESELLGHKSPIFGRRTATFKLEPFSYRESRELLAIDDPVKSFEAWGVLGGMPLYLKQYRNDKSLKINVVELILDKGTLLHNEPIFALKQELKEPALYFSIIEAISRGKSKYNEISTFIGTDSGYYLNTLVQLGIVMKLTPIGLKASTRKSIYHLKDPFFSFWFRYVSRGYSLIEMDKKELLYSQVIEKDISKFLGMRFEDLCIEYLWELNGSQELPFFEEIGRWWGTNPVTKLQEEIDIVALDQNNQGIICECKWKNEKTGISEIEKLYRRSQLIKREHKVLIFFSKAEYTTGARDYAREKGIRLVLFKDMFWD